MPRVPAPQLQDVARSTPAPTPYASPAGATAESFGGGTAQAVGQLGDVAGQLYQHEKAKADSARIMQLVGDFGTEADALLHNPDTGALNVQGEKALAIYQPTVEQLGKLQQSKAANLTDPRVRQLFMEHSSSVLRTAVRQMEIHASGQKDKLEELGLVSTQKAMADSAVKAIDQISADSYAAKAAEATRAFWATRANQRVADEKTKEYVAVVNGQRLDRLLADPNTASEAQQFFKLKYDALPTAKIDEYTKKVEAVSVAQQANAKAIEITAKTMGRDGQIDRRKAQGLVDQLPGGLLKDAVQHRVDHRASVFDQAWKDESTTLAANVVAQGIDPVTGEFNLGLVNPADMTALELKWNAKAVAIKKGAAAEGAKARYATAVEHFFGPEGWQETARMTPQEFLTNDQMLALPAKHRTALIERFQAQQKRIGRPPPEALVVEEARQALGLGENGKIGSLSDEKKAAFADLYDAVKDQVKEFAINHSGQTPDREAVRKMVRDELNVVSSKWFGFSKTRQYETRKKPAAAAPAKATLPPLNASPAAQTPAGQLKVKAPDGTIGFIPAAQRDAAVKAGYTFE